MKQKGRNKTGRIVALLMLFVLVVAYAIPFSAAVPAQAGEAQDAEWYDSIEEMLAAGEYEEGVVVVGIDMSKAKKAGNPASALEDTELGDDTEELVDGEGVCITSISQSNMTTAELLNLLASDDSIVFAEPNYIVSSEDEEEPAIDESGNEAEEIASAKEEGSEPEQAADAKEEISNIAEGSNDSGEIPADAEEDSETKEIAVAADTDNEPADYTIVSPARDVTALQWSSSDDSTFRGPNKQGMTSMNVPGWPDGSNMEHEIIVAVLDYPVDFSNPDLEDKAYTFSPDLQEKLGCDVHGFNATWESQDGKLELFEDGNHGTHVAGIIGASWDGKGINGVGSDVRIVSVQIANEDGKTSLVNVLRGMNFVREAKENGVDIRITNNSWGLMQNSKALDAAVTELGNSGIISFFAASNEGQNLYEYQHLVSTLAENPYAVIVASTDVSGNLSNFSNYGSGVATLAAPGTDILSCIKEENYIPALAENNTFYEDFENDTTDLKIYQIDPETGEKVEGSEGVITRGNETMGFEGENVISVPVDHNYVKYVLGDPMCVFRVDFSGVAGVDLHSQDFFGLAFAGAESVSVLEISGYSLGIFFGVSNHKASWNTCSAPLEEMEIGEGPYITLTMDVSTVDEVYFDTIGIGSEKHPYKIMSGTSMASPAAAGAAAVIASRHYDELSAGDAESAEKLAAYVCSSVRPMPALADKVTTGGIIDLSVEETAEIPDRQPVQENSGILYETEHTVDTDTGDPFAFDPPLGGDPMSVRMADAESSGIMMALGDKIYYMPVVAEVEEEPAYRTLCCYDIASDEWITDSIPAYPAWIAYASGAVYNGKLYVKGLTTQVDESTDVPYYDEYAIRDSGEVLLYSYTPGDNSWKGCSVEEVYSEQTLFSTDSGLMLGGSHFVPAGPGEEHGHYAHDFRKYDPETGAGEVAGNLPGWITNPLVVYAFGHICLADHYGDVLYVMDSDLSEGTATEIYTPTRDPNQGPESFPDTNTTQFTLAGDEEMLVWIFTDIWTGSGDTFILRDGETAFTPYEKQASNSTLFGPSAVIKDGRLYVLSSALNEPDMRLFRSTLLREPAPDPAPAPGPTPGSGGGNVPTGDSSAATLWIILAVLSVLAIAGSVVLIRKRKA